MFLVQSRLFFLEQSSISYVCLTVQFFRTTLLVICSWVDIDGTFNVLLYLRSKRRTLWLHISLTFMTSRDERGISKSSKFTLRSTPLLNENTMSYQKSNDDDPDVNVQY